MHYLFYSVSSTQCFVSVQFQCQDAIQAFRPYCRSFRGLYALFILLSVLPVKHWRVNTL